MSRPHCPKIVPAQLLSRECLPHAGSKRGQDFASVYHRPTFSSRLKFRHLDCPRTSFDGCLLRWASHSSQTESIRFALRSMTIARGIDAQRACIEIDDLQQAANEANALIRALP